MTINHRLYKDGDLTRAGENFAIAQQERLVDFSDEDLQAELGKIKGNLTAELGNEKDAGIVMDAIEEFIEDVGGFLGEGI